MSTYTGPIGIGGYGWQPCPKCGRETFISYYGMKCNYCGYNTFSNTTVSDKNSGRAVISKPTGRVITGEQSTLEDIVRMIEILYSRLYNQMGDCAELNELLSRCRERLGIGDEE